MNNGKIIQPHGGRLINRFEERRSNPRSIDEFKSSFKLTINNDKMRDVENIASGVFSPLEGFNGEEDLDSIIQYGRLKNWIPWTIPILLDADKDLAKEAYESGDILLNEPNGDGLAIMRVEEKYVYDKKMLAKNVYGTDDPSHPGVSRVYNMKDYLLGGKINLLRTGSKIFPEYDLNPSNTRDIFKGREWNTIVGFQTRNVPHIGHEYLQKTALSFTDGLFINPVIGKKKAGDFRDEVILGSYEVLTNFYFPRDRVLLGILRTEMRYAGPKEAIFHAIIRQNYGCSHFVVGRDHAGVGNYYDPYEAQNIFHQFKDLEITPLFFTAFFFCNKCESVSTEKTCPHGKEFRSPFSGTLLRKLLSKDDGDVKHLVRSEVLDAISNMENPFID